MYESAPPSPRKKALALPPPTTDDGPTVSLGDLGVTAKMPSSCRANERNPAAPSIDNASIADFEEGTPEYIRRRFFPSAASHDPSLAWIEAGDSGSTSDPANPTLRFDLSGSLIAPEVSLTLPTHLGLHHHAEGSHAGYTLDDLFLLSRSTVPAQRASMIDVLGRVARRIGKTSRSRSTGIPQLRGQEGDLRKRILAAGVEAMTERGTLGIRALEVMWTCIVAWDEDLTAVHGVELKDFSADGALASIPLDYVLQELTTLLSVGVIPQESLNQILAIIHRMSQESNDIATSIVETKGLVGSVVQRFILTSYPPEADSPLPEPFAIELLTTLAQSSRSNASALLAPADALLRFIITQPQSSPYTHSLATSLLTSTLRFYSALSSYGLNTQVATTAQEQLHEIRRYILSDDCQSAPLRSAWLGLLEAWMVCARDPHTTIPEHSILWSQVVGWGWADDILSLRSKLTPEHPDTWALLWRALAAWLEGASVNGVKGGETEKHAVIEAIRDCFVSGAEHTIVEDCMRKLNSLLHDAYDDHEANWKVLAAQADVLSGVIRLWVACLPTSSQPGLSGPPFSLPFPQISNLNGRLATHPLWGHLASASVPSIIHVHLRHLSQLLTVYLNMSRVLPGTSDDLWIAQAVSVLTRHLPGDEDSAIRTIGTATSLITPEFMQSRSWPVPPVIWEKKGLEPIVPFLHYALRRAEVRVGPLWMTPQSISQSTTQRLPPLSSCRPGARNDFPLPISRDWPLLPLNYLLRSGQTDIFKSLPSSWDASEVDLTRASLLLARVLRQILAVHGLGQSNMSREEVIFGCMKVFMLEHGQQQESTTSTEEVFRDNIVREFMKDLLGPHTLGSSRGKPQDADSPLLDTVAKRFLGTSTPFYQWYTDFVSLYDAVSFSHPLFASLLIPPLSMKYPSDFRKYLWADYSHVIRTVKTPLDSIVAGSVEEFLWPVETNTEVITGYLRAVTRGEADGFLRLIAVHHIACSIWPDLRMDDAEASEEKAAKLLQALVGQGEFVGVKEVVWYKQTPNEPALLPPACFEQKGDWMDERRAFVGRYGSDVQGRLENLL